jgi:hypothetical protein
VWADGKMVSQAVEGTIDYYNKNRERSERGHNPSALKRRQYIVAA